MARSVIMPPTAARLVAVGVDRDAPEHQALFFVQFAREQQRESLLRVLVLERGQEAEAAAIDAQRWQLVLPHASCRRQ
jgi:hypothetical protein